MADKITLDLDRETITQMIIGMGAYHNHLKKIEKRPRQRKQLMKMVRMLGDVLKANPEQAV